MFFLLCSRSDRRVGHPPLRHSWSSHRSTDWLCPSISTSTPHKSGICSGEQWKKTLLSKVSWHKSWFMVFCYLKKKKEKERKSCQRALVKYTEGSCIYLWESDEGLFTTATFAANMLGAAGEERRLLSLLENMRHLLKHRRLFTANLRARILSLIRAKYVKTVKRWWANVLAVCAVLIYLKGSRRGREGETLNCFAHINCNFTPTCLMKMRRGCWLVSSCQHNKATKAGEVITVWHTLDAAELQSLPACFSPCCYLIICASISTQCILYLVILLLRLPADCYDWSAGTCSL